MDRSPDQVLATMAKFAGCLRKAGMPPNFYQQTIDDLRFRAWLVEYCRSWLVDKSPSQQAARAIMGPSMLGVPEVFKYFGDHDKKALEHLDEVPFSQEMLSACAMTHVLVADIGLSIHDLSERAPELFHPLIRINSIPAEVIHETRYPYRWHLIRRTIVPNSLNNDWVKQRSLLKQHEGVPNARAIAYMMCLYQLATGEKLFANTYARVSTTWENHRIAIGNTNGDHDGIHLLGFMDDRQYPVLGLASAHCP